jgi:hypothetical protein
MTQEVVVPREKEDPLTVASMSNMAFSQQGKGKEAESMFEVALTTREKLLGIEDPLDPKITHIKSSSSFTLTASLLLLLRRLFASTNLPEGITRIKWTCCCGYFSYDDLPLNSETAKTLEDDLRHGKILRHVEVTNKRPGLLYEWLLSLQKGVIGPFWRHISSGFSNPGSNSSGPLDSSNAGSQSSAGGLNLQTPLEDSGDLGAASLSRLEQRKPLLG